MDETSLVEREAMARAVLEEASEAVKSYRKNKPPFTPVPVALYDRLAAARDAHDAAYAAYAQL